MKQKRLKFKCWHCQEQFSLFRQFDPLTYYRLRVKCPFCERYGILEMNKHLKPASNAVRMGEDEAEAFVLPADAESETAAAETPMSINLDQVFELDPDEDEDEAHE